MTWRPVDCWSLTCDYWLILIVHGRQTVSHCQDSSRRSIDLRDHVTLCSHDSSLRSIESRDHDWLHSPYLERRYCFISLSGRSYGELDIFMRTTKTCCRDLLLEVLFSHTLWDLNEYYSLQRCRDNFNSYDQSSEYSF